MTTGNKSMANHPFQEETYVMNNYKTHLSSSTPNSHYTICQTVTSCFVYFFMHIGNGTSHARTNLQKLSH
jgi:hypothetical protein